MSGPVFVLVIALYGATSVLFLWLGPRHWILQSRPAQHMYAGVLPPWKHLNYFGRIVFAIFFVCGSAVLGMSVFLVIG